VRAVGVIRSIARRTLPSPVGGQRERVVGRVGLAIDSLCDERGAPIDKSNYVGLEFEGAPDLADRFSVGDRVTIDTTTPGGMHIAKIQRLN